MVTVEAIVFDYYETLGELSHATRERLFGDLARRVGLDLPPGEAYRHWRERTTKDATLRFGGLERAPLDGAKPPFIAFRDVWLRRFEELFREWQVDAPPELGADAYADVHAHVRVYSEVRRTLDALRERYRLAVLSDADRDFLEASVQRNDLAFDAVIASEELRVYKPHVSVFRETCARLRIEPAAALYVGDSPWNDVEGARHAGMRAVWVNRHGSSWPEDIEPPPTVVRALDELMALLASPT